MGRTSKPGAYGQRLGDIFGLKAPPPFIIRTLSRTTIAVTQIVCDVENNGLTAPIPREDAFLATMQLRPCPRHDLWIDGKPQKTGYLAAGSLSIYDLRQNPIANSISPFRNLHFYLPHKVLNAIADSDGAPRVDELMSQPGLGVDDPIFKGLATSLLPAFENPQEVSPLFIDHVTVAIAAHLARVYGTKAGKPARITLSDREERQIKELLASRLDGGLTVAELADACGLPVSQFAEAFRRATGLTPHRWIECLQLARARDLLQQKNVSLAEVAAATGFASADHLGRALARADGAVVVPWREYSK
ncbi:helix-turn-helix domain-containing protein [Sinorhizobium chiapasense]|uniref:Helix-turn-helix domain-containing protein n=1 Tax=Sinorhizobium chiapasense TaxID=501572 RepID=A0ABZ2B9L0_9HYPH